MLLCRRQARFLTSLALLAACSGSGRPGRAPAPPALAAEATGEPDAGGATLAERYYRAYLSETVDGNLRGARGAYEEVLETGGAEARGVAARAALRLAGLDGQEGKSREALELLARAASLGGDDPALLEAVDALRLQLAGSEPRTDTGLRGPAPGTPLDGAGAKAAGRFAGAERLLDAYQRRRVRARIEKFDEDRNRKESALRAAEDAYRQVVALGDPVGTAAAAFRIASLHHDYALLVLTLETPPELEPAYAAPVRRDLRLRAQRNFKDAQAAYAESLAAGAEAPGAELWHAAARSGARAVEDMLR
jgi:hypothetical protein